MKKKKERPTTKENLEEKFDNNEDVLDYFSGKITFVDPTKKKDDKKIDPKKDLKKYPNVAKVIEND